MIVGYSLAAQSALYQRWVVDAARQASVHPEVPSQASLREHALAPATVVLAMLDFPSRPS
jgi:hypothetical protein